MSIYEDLQKDLIEQRESLLKQNKSLVGFFKELSATYWKDRIIKASVLDILQDLDKEKEILENERTRK